MVRVLARSELPLSHTEVLGRLGDTDWDPAMIYRNLIKLRDAGVAPVVSRVGVPERVSGGTGTGEGTQVTAA